VSDVSHRGGTGAAPSSTVQALLDALTARVVVLEAADTTQATTDATQNSRLTALEAADVTLAAADAALDTRMDNLELGVGSRFLLASTTTASFGTGSGTATSWCLGSALVGSGVVEYFVAPCAFRVVAANFYVNSAPSSGTLQMRLVVNGVNNNVGSVITFPTATMSASSMTIDVARGNTLRVEGVKSSVVGTAGNAILVLECVKT
jgi:hypothetical protein